MFKYRLHLEDSSDLGEAAYAQMVKSGETIWAAGATKFRVIAVVLIEEEDESPYVGLLKVKPS